MPHRLSRVRIAVTIAVCLVSAARAHAQAGGAAVPTAGPTLAALVAGMRETPGCLGVETARTTSGKQMVLAWFQDREALARWYATDLFRGVMKQIFGGEQPADPIVALKDNPGPVLVVASITIAEKTDARSIAISQMAVELYQPAAGGIAAGGRLAPEKMHVPGLKVIGSR